MWSHAPEAAPTCAYSGNNYSPCSASARGKSAQSALIFKSRMRYWEGRLDTASTRTGEVLRSSLSFLDTQEWKYAREWYRKCPPGTTNDLLPQTTLTGSLVPLAARQESYRALVADIISPRMHAMNIVTGVGGEQ